MRSKTLWMWLVTHALFAALSLSFAHQDKPACESCRDRGASVCKLCESKVCSSELGYTFCSVELECGDCDGTRWVECPMCDRAPTLDLAQKRAEAATWRSSKKDIEEFMSNRGMLFLDSAHFEFVFDVLRLDVKGAGSVHAAAHVYLDRLEKLHTEFRTATGIPEDKFNGRTRVLLWSSERDQERASSKYTLEPSKTQSKLMGKNPVVSICVGKGATRDDQGLHHALVHQVTHCLLSNAYDGVWLGSLKAGWIDEGTAHAFEHRAFGSITTWCSMPERTLKDAKLGAFDAVVRNALETSTVIELSSFAGFDTAALSPLQRVFAWSYCDFLLRERPGKLGPLARELKKNKLIHDALTAALETDAAAFQLDWRVWADATYPKKRK